MLLLVVMLLFLVNVRVDDSASITVLLPFCCPFSALLITDDCARNSQALCGRALLQSVHLKRLGFCRVLALPRGLWRRADNKGKKQLLLSRLAALEGAPGARQQQHTLAGPQGAISSGAPHMVATSVPQQR